MGHLQDSDAQSVCNGQLDKVRDDEQLFQDGVSSVLANGLVLT